MPAKHIYTVNVPGLQPRRRRLFVGQRQEAFAVNLGVIFDLVNAPLEVITNPALIGAVPNTIGNKNVSTMALEVHKELPEVRPHRRRRDRRLDHRQPAPERACSTPRRRPATRPPRSPAASGCRSRAWACPWSTRW